MSENGDKVRIEHLEAQNQGQKDDIRALENQIHQLKLEIRDRDPTHSIEKIETELRKIQEQSSSFDAKVGRVVMHVVWALAAAIAFFKDHIKIGN